MTDTESTPKRGFFGGLKDWFTGKGPLWILVGLFGLGMILSQTRSYLVSKELHNEMDQAELTFSAQADARVESETGKILTLAMRPLAWLMKDELIMEDPYQIDSYLGKLARYPGVVHVYLTDPNGLIIHTSDPALQGNPFEIFGKDLLMRKDVSVHLNRDGSRSFIAPVSGPDLERMGMVVLAYKAE
jgi:hypothetical protein